MSWQDSRRAQRLPDTAASGWAQAHLARQVIERDHGRCYLCGRLGADIADHVVALAEGGAHDETNMAAVHRRPCHEQKTAAEAARARARRPTTRRPAEQHPGLVR